MWIQGTVLFKYYEDLLTLREYVIVFASSVQQVYQQGYSYPPALAPLSFYPCVITAKAKAPEGVKMYTPIYFLILLYILYYESISPHAPCVLLQTQTHINHRRSSLITHHLKTKLRGNLKLVLNRRWLASVLCCLCLLYLQPGRQIFSPPIIKRDLIDKS